MTLRKNAEKIHDLDILDEIEKNPNATQATMANQMNVAIGTVNWHLKRLIDKGYVKIQRCEKKKLKYLITPEGISLRAKLTVDYIHSSFEMYRLIRQRMTACHQKLDKLAQALLLDSPMHQMEKGYAFVTDDSGKGISRVEGRSPGEKIFVRLMDGTMGARVETIMMEKDETDE